jgi:ATP-dependent DNA ligase
MERDITTFENLLECIVSKRKHSRYRSGRSHDWLKMKNPNATGGEAESRKGLGR